MITLTVVSPVYSISSPRAVLRTQLVSSLSAVDRYIQYLLKNEESLSFFTKFLSDRTKDELTMAKLLVTVKNFQNTEMTQKELKLP